MTQRDILDRINEAADSYGFRVPYDGSKNFYDYSAVAGFIVGAKRERNSVLIEAIELLVAHINNGAIIDEPFVRKELSSLKVDL